jgi:hypothetical protein
MRPASADGVLLVRRVSSCGCERQQHQRCSTAENFMTGTCTALNKAAQHSCLQLRGNDA